jgi:hypothetical protein
MDKSRFTEAAAACISNGERLLDDAETPLHSPGDASAQEHCQGSDGAQAGDPLVLDVEEWL